MRALVLFLAVAVATGMIPGAQCVVSCATPANAPPCHHAPGKQSPAPRGACDSLTMTAGESPVVRLANREADTALGVVARESMASALPVAAPLKLASFRQPPRPPEDARNLVLRL